MNKTVVVIAGTTNGYIAEELLKKIGQAEEFDRKSFIRGITMPPHYQKDETGRLNSQSVFPGDVIIQKGKWLKGQTINDIADKLQCGDIIMKGANAVNFQQNLAGILIGSPTGGTILTAMQAIIGRRVTLYLPVGQEKRVTDDLHEIAAQVNAADARGCRLYVTSGKIISEVEALSLLSGVQARLMAAGGVCGAEGGIWLSLTGNAEHVNQACSLLDKIAAEPAFSI